MKIIKHCKESMPDQVTGLLLGFANGSTLEVTHSFPYRFVVFRFASRAIVSFGCAFFFFVYSIVSSLLLALLLFLSRFVFEFCYCASSGAVFASIFVRFFLRLFVCDNFAFYPNFIFTLNKQSNNQIIITTLQYFWNQITTKKKRRTTGRARKNPRHLRFCV